ncbi:hypothetical protein AQPE_4810 [Aquipluma nitroreducens]|uniref:Uncharacterized protein n=1 Tax=Aquipluma nitroreducens TaxID=2010828 RepID=A0A5K7SGJ1_9BACT|nr:hypothetical protein AQPE_4810 [Aquipluma nitroreducens]
MIFISYGERQTIFSFLIFPFEWYKNGFFILKKMSNFYQIACIA